MAYQFPEDKLNIHSLCRSTTALGPGRRFVIWTQGCLKKCQGCITPEGQYLVDNILFSPKDLADEVLKTTKMEGITISGGEPFLQAENLSLFLEYLFTQRKLSIIIYTGYTLKELKGMAQKNIDRLIHLVDVLIDGEYQEKLNDDKGLRGSSNQRVHLLTDYYAHCYDQFHNTMREVDWRGDQIIGIKPKGLDAFFMEIIRKKRLKKNYNR